MRGKNHKSILLVEDEIIVAMLEKRQLEDMGYLVHHVVTGEAAVKIALENATPIDLILMDIDLGSGIDGTEAAGQILERKDIPVVFLSSHTEAELVEKTEKITSYGYVVKSSNSTVLDTSIKMAFKLFMAKQILYEKEKDLLYKHEFMNYVIEHNRSAIAVHDKELNYLYVSKQYLKTFRVKECNVIGKHHYEVFPDLPQKWREVHQKALKGIVSSAENDVFEREDGTIDWTRWECRPWYEQNGNIGGIVIYTEVINDRINAEIQLRESEHKYRTLANSGKALIWTSSLDKACDYFNKPWLTFTGRSLEQELGHGWTEGIFPDDYARCLEIYTQAFNLRKTFSMDYRLKHHSGEYRWIQDDGSPRYNARGDFIGYIGHCLDITERKVAEAEIQKQLSEKEILLREIHHRVKNNLMNIESLLRLQTNATSFLEAKTELQKALSRVQSMRILYDKLLLSKDIHILSMKTYTENLIDSLLAVFDIKSNVTVQKNIEEFNILSKKAISIGIIINELLVNIFKYAFRIGDNGIISISIKKMENIATLIIQDDGIGIAIDGNGKLVHSSGLGLSIVEMLVKQLDGTYRVMNDNGTKIIIQFEI